MQWEFEELQLKLRQASSTAKHINNLDMELINKTVASEVMPLYSNAICLFFVQHNTQNCTDRDQGKISKPVEGFCGGKTNTRA